RSLPGPRRQLLDPQLGLVGSHERLSHQDRVRTRFIDPPRVLRIVDPALGHHDDAWWNQLAQPFRQIEVNLEGAQVAVVYADQPGTGLERDRGLLLVVHLHEGAHSATLDYCEQLSKTCTQRSHDQQYRVGS